MPKVHIDKFCSPKDDQECQIGTHVWSIPRLISISKDFPVEEMPIRGLNVYHVYKSLTLRQMVTHMQAVLNADLSYPIILDEDGELMDGRHRIMKALLEERETIKFVRFDTNPAPCYVK